MPTLENYLHADTPHERTVAPAGYRYGCHSERLGNMPRGRKSVPARAQDGWTDDGGRRVVHYASDWIEMTCGHSARQTDSACGGCGNRNAEVSGGL